jgi:hypothetical protein
MVARFVPDGRELVFKPDGTRAIEEFTNSTIALGNAVRKTLETPARAADVLQNGESKQETKSNTTAASAKKNLPAKVTNPMEVFASSNVLWTFACLTPQQFNDPKSYRDNPTALKNIVFSSAGRFDADRVATFFGSPEYYINNFVMQTVIGANEATGNSNAIKFSFDIIEPHSMGLLLQSMQNAAVKAQYLSYLDNAPFVLRMDIQGFNELGQNLSQIKPKYFVMKLSSTKFTVNEGGSVYKVEAIPYNHQGFSDVINTTYSDVKLVASGPGLVFDLLSGSEGSLVAYLNDNEKKLKADGKITETDEYVIQFPILSSDWQSSAGNQAEIKRATADLGKKEQITAVSADVIKKDPQLLDKNYIASASLGFNQSSGGKAVFKRAGDQYDEKTGVLIRDGMTIDPKTRAFQFGQNQSLTAIINQVILSSEYATNALKPQNLTPQGFIKWFKLDVQLELLNPDKLTGDYAKKITYRVVPYLVHQSIFANATSAPVGYAELMKDVVKEYQYIYTGQNVDILSFSIDINNLFYAGANPKPEADAAKTATQDQNTSETKNAATKTGKGQAKEVQGAQTGRSRPKRDPRLLKGFKGGSDYKTVEQNVAENFQEAFISGSSADMVTVNLEILGDPYWLIDSGMSNYFVGAASPTAQITDDGTMNYESGNVYIYISFRTPADINTETGLYDFSVSGKESAFGGIYRIVACENTFNDGNWKQKLKCIRMPGPQGPEVNETITGEKASVVNKAEVPAIEIGEKEPPKTSIVDNSSGNSNVGADSVANAAAPVTSAAPNQSQRRVGFRYYRDLGQN